ncbi:MAG: S-adenosylmethionine:tRNA ribosyltransferase-isomerase, partial [Burkholderiaceae bacterium]
MNELKLSDFDFDLPPELIAQHPLANRTDSRLLRVLADGFEDLSFADLEGVLRPGDLLVFNDTRVIKARLHGAKESGGRIEALVERVTAPARAILMIRASKSPKPGSRVLFGEGDATVAATVIGRQDEFFELDFGCDVLAVLDRLGEVPLPPYITHGADAADESRYQTVYAAHPGAVAAPTPGLHFTPELIAALRARGGETAVV